jgi:FtsP/CotA-like multicopper oxidase with cupredoxin domain
MKWRCFPTRRRACGGQPQPTTEVDTAWHRVRLLNASNARIYKLAWSRDRYSVS